MRLYCERVLFDNELEKYDIIFDSYSFKDLELFGKIVNLANDYSPSKTLLTLNGVRVNKYKGPRAGFWYDIPISFFENFIIKNEQMEYKLIRYNLTMREERTLNFHQHRIKDKSLFINDEKTVGFKHSLFFKCIEKYDNYSDIDLIVRAVGCGNWNEIVTDNFRIMYDLGGDIKFTDEEMDEIISKANLTKPFYTVISHWDLDHYRALIDLKDKELKLLKNIVVPAKMPNTLQLNNALNRLKYLGIPIDIIDPSPKLGRRIKLISKGKVNGIELFRSNDGANINQSGIVLSIEGNEKIGVLTGDHHYPQIYHDVINVSSLKPYEIVVPHHGGNAGNFDINLWNKVNISSGALSTKSFRYRSLPQKKIHNFFVSQHSFHCTDCNSIDYKTRL